MKKTLNKDILIELLVIVTLLGYIATSVTVFINADTSCMVYKNEALFTVLQGLTAFIGGFVAFAFGVSEKPKDNEDKTEVKKINLKITSLGSFTTRSSDEDKQGVYGSIFILLYLLFGIASIVIWVVLNDKTLESVKDMATTFFAILIPIVSAYLYKNNR
ncbi:MAG TPA: hypothetical protein EYG85_05890 [Crocinitomix sp.]|nr:hypothetical protein [Crocinitomix sp.]